MIKLKKSTVPYLPNPYPGVRTLLYLGENLDIENILSFHPDLKSGKYLNDLYGSECSLVISYVKNTVGDPDFFSKYILSTVTGKDINSYNYLLSAMLKQNLFESLSAKDRYIISEIIRSKFNSFALESVFNSDNPIPVKMAVARFNSAMSFEYSLKNKPEESGKSDLSGLPAIWNKISRPEETMLGINARLDTLIAISPNLLKPPLYKIKKLLSEVSSYTDSNANEFHKQLKEARKEFIDAALKQEKIDNILNDKELNYFSLAQQYKDYFAIIKKQKNTIRLLCPGLDSYLDNEEKQ